MKANLENSTNWNDLPDLDEITLDLELNDKDCLEEIRKILVLYKKEDKFGVNLLHKHFDLQQDEILIETQDVENRTLTISPMTKNQISQLGINNYRPTSWRFDLNSVTAFYMCPFGMYGDHYGYRD